MIVVRSYKYRIYPTKEQEQTLIKFAGCRRFVWNWGLNRKQETYRTTGKSLTYQALASELVTLKRQPETMFLQECQSQVLQQVLMDLEDAFKHFFAKRTKYPRFKSRKKTLHSLRFPQYVTVIDKDAISVPKVGVVRAVIHRPLAGVAKGATINQLPTGLWYVSFVCHIERPNVMPAAKHPVGIDVGLESFMTLHNGIKVHPPKFYRRGERKLKMLHRRLSRKEQGSNNYRKSRKTLARAHARIRNQRNDWLHKRSLGIIQQFDTVCIEDLNLRGLVKTKLAKSFSDAAIGTFMQMLGEKVEWHGRQLIKVGRFFASSKTCHYCHTKTTLSLADRVWICAICGTRHDRDVNAAINILHEGVRILAAGQSRG